MLDKEKLKDLEHQYVLFLERMNLDESKMHPIQKKQIKQTFFGAWGQSLIFMRDEIAKFDEDTAVEIMEANLEFIANYFLKEVGRQN